MKQRGKYMEITVTLPMAKYEEFLKLQPKIKKIKDLQSRIEELKGEVNDLYRLNIEIKKSGSESLVQRNNAFSELKDFRDSKDDYFFKVKELDRIHDKMQDEFEIDKKIYDTEMYRLIKNHNIEVMENSYKHSCKINDIKQMSVIQFLRWRKK